MPATLSDVITPEDSRWKDDVERLVKASWSDMAPSRHPNTVWVLDNAKALTMSVSWDADQHETSIVGFPLDAPFRDMILLTIGALDALLARLPDAAKHPLYGVVPGSMEASAQSWASLGDGSYWPVGKGKDQWWRIEGEPLSRVLAAFKRNILTHE